MASDENEYDKNGKVSSIDFEIDEDTLILNKAPIKRQLKPESKSKRIRIRLPQPLEHAEKTLNEQIKPTDLSQQTRNTENIITQQVIITNVPPPPVHVQETLREFSRREKKIDYEAQGSELNESLRKGPPFTCKLCNVWFLVKGKLSVHYVTNHNCEHCSLCNLIFCNITERVEHEQRVHFPIECEVCLTPFKDNWVLNEHYETDHDTIACLFCGILIQPKTCYVNHIRRKHVVYEQYFEMEDGLKIVDNWKSKWNFRCRLCNKSRHKKDFVGHYYMHHKITVASLIQLIASENLDVDIAGNKDDDTPEMPDTSGPLPVPKDSSKNCSVCHMKNNNNVPALFHQVYCHTNHGCKNCLKIFTDKQSLEAHIEKIHRYFQCVLGCSKIVCSSEDQIFGHYDKFHDIVTCRYCEVFVSAMNNKYELHLKNQHKFKAVIMKTKSETTLFETISKDDEMTVMCCLCDKDITSMVNDVEAIYLHFAQDHFVAIKSIVSLIKPNPLPNQSEQSLTKTKNCICAEGVCNSGSCTCTCINCNNTKETNNLSENDSKNISQKIKKEPTDSDADDENDPTFTVNEDGNTDIKGAVEDIDPVEIECYFDETSEDESSDGTDTEVEPETDGIKIKSEPIDPDIDVEGETPNDVVNLLVKNERKAEVLNDYKCDICDFTCNQKREMLEHAHMTHGFLVKVSLLTCDECLETFTSGDSYEIHMINAHGKEITKCREKRYTCPFCEFKDKKKTVRMHLKKNHTSKLDGINPPTKLGFKCRYCEDSFWGAADRNDHEVEKHSKTYSESFFKCFVCFKTFSSRLCLKRHVHTTHKLEPRYLRKNMSYKCLKCLVLIPRLEETRNHFNLMHPALRIFRCTLSGCNARLKTKKTYVMHVKNVHNTSKKGGVVFGGPASCQLCGKWLANQRAANTHYRMKHSQDKRIGYGCRLCTMRFDSVEKRKLHYSTAHQGVRAYICNECGKGFNSKSGLYGHKQLHMNNSFECEYCHKSFVRRDTFNEHLLIHSGPRHQCPYCPRSFTQRSNLTRHTRIHTGDKPYSCTMCPKRFSDKGACNSHMRVHTREEESSCPYCGKTFSKKQKLNYHMRKHTGEGLVSCPTCNKVFTNSFSLKEHRLTHEQGTQVLCGQCGRGFSHERYLKRHIAAMHTTGGRKYACPLCSKRFVAQNQLNSHVMTHSGVKHMQCLLCDTAYSSRKSMSRHLLLVHKISAATESDDSINKYFYQMTAEEAGLVIPGITDNRNNSDDESPTMVPLRSTTLTIAETAKLVALQNSDDESSNKKRPPIKLILHPKKMYKKKHRRPSFKTNDIEDEDAEELVPVLETKSRKIKRPQRYNPEPQVTTTMRRRRSSKTEKLDCFEPLVEIQIKEEPLDDYRDDL